MRCIDQQELAGVALPNKWRKSWFLQPAAAPKVAHVLDAQRMVLGGQCSSPVQHAASDVLGDTVKRCDCALLNYQTVADGFAVNNTSAQAHSVLLLRAWKIHHDSCRICTSLKHWCYGVRGRHSSMPLHIICSLQVEAAAAREHQQQAAVL